MVEILCLIPARSGSKGIPNKNIKIFRQKPLLVWSIEQAISCRYKMRIIVSTDSEEYSNIAKVNGAEVPFLRPNKISGDLSTDYEFIKYTLDKLSNEELYFPDIIVQLRPTYPTRNIELLDKCIEKFLTIRNEFDSLRTVIPFEKSPFKMYLIENNILNPLFKQINEIHEPYNQCRQILPQTYLHNGCIDILNTNIIYDKKSISGDKIYPHIMNVNECNDIDTMDDWVGAEKLYK